MSLVNFFPDTRYAIDQPTNQKPMDPPGWAQYRAHAIWNRVFILLIVHLSWVSIYWSTQQEFRWFHLWTIYVYKSKCWVILPGNPPYSDKLLSLKSNPSQVLSKNIKPRQPWWGWGLHKQNAKENIEIASGIIIYSSSLKYSPYKLCRR